MAGEGYDDSCALSVFRTWKEVWGSSYAILELTVHSDCVMVIKYSMSLRTKESCMWTKDKNDMQAWLAEVLKIIDYVEFWSEIRKMYSHTNFVWMM